MDSERLPNSLQMRLNSFEGMVQTELNYVSGIPNVSLSRFIKGKVNSDIFYPPNIRFYVTFRFKLKLQTCWLVLCTQSHPIIRSCQLKNLCHIFNCNTYFIKIIPKTIGLGQLKYWKAFSLSYKETKATWHESIAWIDIPLVLTSILTILTRSLIESMIFRNTETSSILAYNILSAN